MNPRAESLQVIYLEYRSIRLCSLIFHHVGILPPWALSLFAQTVSVGQLISLGVPSCWRFSLGEYSVSVGHTVLVGNSVSLDIISSWTVHLVGDSFLLIIQSHWVLNLIGQ